MGFFTKLFKKKDEQKTEITVNFVEENGIVSAEPDIPSLQGDYAKTIFLWAHSKASPVKENKSYARYFLYECGIRNAEEYHRGLIAAGYFEPASIQQNLNTLKVTELKEILAEFGQSTTGKKDVLIERIVSNVDSALIARYCPEKQYVLTALGQTFLENHDDYVMVHKHKNWGVDWKEYDAHKVTGKSYYDTMWAIFNEQLSNGARDYGRTQYLYMHQLLNEEGKRELALQMLLRVLYIDFSGVEGLQWYDMYRQGFYKEKEVRECFSIAIMMAPGILNSIKEYEDIYSDVIVDRIYEQQLPIQICEKKLFLAIVHSVLDGTYNQEATEEKLKRAYYKFLREELFV